MEGERHHTMKRAIKNAMITGAAVIGLTTATSEIQAAPARQSASAAAASAGKVECARSGHPFAGGYCGVVHSKDPRAGFAGRPASTPAPAR